MAYKKPYETIYNMIYDTICKQNNIRYLLQYDNCVKR